MQFGKYSSFSFVDVETTGLTAHSDRVLEIGILRVENGELTGKLSTLLDPGVYIPPEITTITGIKDEDIRSAPTFPDIVDQVEALLDGSVFVAHNARFDHAFIKHEFRRLGLSFNPKTLDTVRLARAFYPKLPRYNLDSIISLMGITVENRHRAFDDAEVLFKFLKRINEEFSPEKTEKVFSSFLKSPSLPNQIQRKDIESLPEGPGVYIMYGADDTILYIGKSVHIKERVLSHFYNDFENTTDLKLNREVKRIEAISTAGDLGASLLEASLIKQKQPILNRALRHAFGMIAIVESEKNGYQTTEILPLKEVSEEKYKKILGVYKSRKQAIDRLRTLAKENKLCLILLGVEKPVRSFSEVGCFGTQIKQCNGACIGEEPSFRYNLRFVQAFSENRVKDWPFEEAIGIKEKSEEREEIHIIDNWCYLGSIRSESDNLEEIKKHSLEFDWDTYKIIKRFISKNIKNIILLPLVHLPKGDDEERFAPA